MYFDCDICKHLHGHRTGDWMHGAAAAAAGDLVRWFMQESMRLMGMKAWLHWMSWFFKYAVFMLISVSIMTILFHIKVNDAAVISYTHWSITFVFLLLYTLSIITFCFAISAFFSKGEPAVLSLYACNCSSHLQEGGGNMSKFVLGF